MCTQGGTHPAPQLGTRARLARSSTGCIPLSSPAEGLIFLNLHEMTRSAKRRDYTIEGPKSSHHMKRRAFQHRKPFTRTYIHKYGTEKQEAKTRNNPKARISQKWRARARAVDIAIRPSPIIHLNTVWEPSRNLAENSRRPTPEEHETPHHNN